jgi:arylsulfatase I/J
VNEERVKFAAMRPQLLILWLAVLPAARAPVTTKTAASLPHLVLTVVDDLGYADVGFAGSQIATPTIDRLAREGVVLTSYYVMRACSPSRAALMSGRYVTRFGFQSGVLKPFKPYGVPLTEVLMPQRLQELGYACHAIGKCESIRPQVTSTACHFRCLTH